MKVTLDPEEKELKRQLYIDIVKLVIDYGIAETYGKIRANSYNPYGGWFIIKPEGEDKWIKIDSKKIEKVVDCIVLEDVDMDGELEMRIIYGWKHNSASDIDSEGIDLIFKVALLGWDSL